MVFVKEACNDERHSLKISYQSCCICHIRKTLMKILHKRKITENNLGRVMGLEIEEGHDTVH